MRAFRYLLLALLLVGIAPGAQSGPGASDAIFQASTLGALSAGVLEGETTLRELEERGDLGLGTLNGLDGELVGTDRGFYRVDAEGKATPVADGDRTPFAVVKAFAPDRTVTVAQPVDYAGLQRFLDQALPTPNIPYALRIRGRFSAVLARSVPRQSRPYPTLARALEQQRTFQFRDVEGVMVGFRMPAYLDGVNAPGYHFHFLTADRRSGGHVLACDIQNVTVEVDEARDMEISLPNTPDFDGASLGP